MFKYRNRLWWFWNVDMSLRNLLKKNGLGYASIKDERERSLQMKYSLLWERMGATERFLEKQLLIHGNVRCLPKLGNPSENQTTEVWKPKFETHQTNRLYFSLNLGYYTLTRMPDVSTLRVSSSGSRYTRFCITWFFFWGAKKETYPRRIFIITDWRELPYVLLLFDIDKINYCILENL